MEHLNPPEGGAERKDDYTSRNDSQPAERGAPKVKSILKKKAKLLLDTDGTAPNKDLDVVSSSKTSKSVMGDVKKAVN